MKNLNRIHFLSLLTLAILVNILSQTLHETGHHMVYQIMGHDPVWGFTKLVQLSETTPTNPEEWTEKTYPDGTTNWLKVNSLPSNKMEEAVTAAAGPMAGLFGAVLGIVIARRSKKITWNQIWLSFSLVSSLVAVLYYLRSPLRVGGDEFDIATQLGTAKSLIEIPLGLAFLACLMLGLCGLPSWRIRLGWLGTVLLGSIVTGLLMTMADPFVIAQVDAGNPWFQPILGYSLPVFVVIVFTGFGIWGWFRWQEKESVQQQ